MLELLSDVLRQVLRAGEAHETTLAAELEFLERYLAIEHVRFSDRLRTQAFRSTPRSPQQPCRVFCCCRWLRTRCGTGSRGGPMRVL